MAKQVITLTRDEVKVLLNAVACARDFSRSLTDKKYNALQEASRKLEKALEEEAT